jgi:creatinine amidohydrolase
MLCEYASLRPGQLQERLHDLPLALVPFGAMEWHSNHLPLGFDGLKAEALLREVGTRLDNGILFPTVFWGCYDTMNFPSTFHFPKRALQKQIGTFAHDLYRMGFRIIVMITGHYPATQVSHLRHVAFKMMRRHHDLAMLAIPEQDLCTDLDYFGDHAARGETSLGLALFPELVDVSTLPEGTSYVDRLKHLGIMGADPRASASKEYGERLRERIVDELANRIARVRDEHAPQAFKEVYRIADAAFKPLYSIRHLDRAVGALGMDSKHDLLSYARWVFLQGSKQQQKKEGGNS